MAKHKAGEATLSDWLGATSDITLLVAGYTGNPALAGAATALGVASFLTSEGGQKMAKSLWDAIQKYGIADPDTDGWLLPPHDFLMEQLFGSSGPDMSNAENNASPLLLTSTVIASKPYPSAAVFSSNMLITRLRGSQQGLR